MAKKTVKPAHPDFCWGCGTDWVNVGYILEAGLTQVKIEGAPAQVCVACYDDLEAQGVLTND